MITTNTEKWRHLLLMYNFTCYKV